MFLKLKNNIFIQAFSLVKYNMVLFIPFFVFLLVTGFVLLPLGSAGGGVSVIYLLIIAPIFFAVFLSGWLNMFKKCVETAVDENSSSEKRTEDSFLLFREFFPGVGRYFLKIVIGILLYLLFYNVFMRVLEVSLIHLLGGFDTFSQIDFINSLKTQAESQAFWEAVSGSDKIKLYKIAGMEFLVTVLLFYITMFWAQIAVIQDTAPLKVFVQSLKTVIKDPVSTFIIFISGTGLIMLVMFFGAIASINAIMQLLVLLLFVYAIVYYLMLTFVYLEKYGPQEKINSDNGPDSLRQD